MEMQTQQGMSAQDAESIEKVVLIGMKILYDKSTFKHFKAGLMKSAPLPQKLAMESAGLMKIIVDKSGGKVPRQAIVPAGRILLLEMAKFMTDAGVAKPTGDDVKEALKMLDALLVQIFVKNKNKKPAQGAQPGPAAPPAQPAPPGGMLAQPQGV